MPLVQDALLSLLDHYHRGDLSLPLIVEKIAHAPADLFAIRERGYIREGYFADLVVADLKGSTPVTRERVLSKCGWSPFEDHTFSSKITMTFVNGSLAFDGTAVTEQPLGDALQFAQDWCNVNAGSRPQLTDRCPVVGERGVRLFPGRGPGRLSPTAHWAI